LQTQPGAVSCCIASACAAAAAAAADAPPTVTAIILVSIFSVSLRTVVEKPTVTLLQNKKYYNTENIFNNPIKNLYRRKAQQRLMNIKKHPRSQQARLAPRLFRWHNLHDTFHTLAVIDPVPIISVALITASTDTRSTLFTQRKGSVLSTLLLPKQTCHDTKTLAEASKCTLLIHMDSPVRMLCP
jgi:hypothetical protein